MSMGRVKLVDRFNRLTNDLQKLDGLKSDLDLALRNTRYVKQIIEE